MKMILLALLAAPGLAVAAEPVPPESGLAEVAVADAMAPDADGALEAAASPVDVVPPPVAPGTRVVVPALTPIYMQIDEPVSSRTSKPGDHFKMSITEDVRVGSAIVIRAGTTGIGEVVHAAKSGGGGKAGELIVAARYVTVDGQEVKLRSFRVGAAGKDHTDDALATSFVAGPFAMFVHGGQLVFPPGTSGSAKTAIEIELPALEPAPAAPQSQPVDTTKKGEENNESKTT